jgi:hypothetical protein
MFVLLKRVPSAQFPMNGVPGGIERKQKTPPCVRERRAAEKRLWMGKYVKVHQAAAA